MNNKNIYILAAAVVAILLIGGASWYVYSNKYQSANQADNANSVVEYSSVVLVPESENLETGDQSSFYISYTNELLALEDTFVSGKLQYDPSKIKIISIENGERWNAINLLDFKTGEETGVAVWEIGVGFGSQHAGSQEPRVLKVVYETIQPGTTSLQLVNGSKVTYITGADVAQSDLKSDPIEVTIN